MIRIKLTIRKLALYICAIWLTIIFIFLPHYVELTGVLETWFPAQGLVYYKDFAAYHFPLGRLILLPLHLLSGWNLELDPYVGLVLGLATLFIIYLFGKRFLSAIGAAISLIFFSIFFWYSATGILFFHEILIGFLLALITYLLFKLHSEMRISYSMLFFLGVLIALTELSGQIATITLAAIFMLIIYEVIKKGDKNPQASIGMLIAGMVLPFLLFSIYFLSQGALIEFYHYNVTYYLLYASYTKDSILSLPLWELSAFYLPLLVLFLVSFFLYTKRQKVDSKAVYIMLLSLSTIPFVIFSIFQPHHLNYALPVLAITAGIAYDKSGQKKFILILAGITFLIIVAALILPWHIERMRFPPSFRIANDLYPDSKDSMKDTVNWIKSNTSKDTKIMVMGDPLFYLRSDRLPASRPSKGIPYGWNPMSQITREVAEKRPDYWIVSREYTKSVTTYWKRPDIVDFIDNELQHCYILLTNFADWQIWQKSCN